MHAVPVREPMNADREADVEAAEATSGSLAEPFRRTDRIRIAGLVRGLPVVVMSLLIVAGIWHVAGPDAIVRTDADGVSAAERGLTAETSPLPADHPVGTNASVTLVSLKRASGLREPLLSTFIVAYDPGGSALLHRAPCSGYVLVHVLSGAIRAQAWRAGVGVYHAGQTWIEPAFASDIATVNASAVEPARALVILVTDDR